MNLDKKELESLQGLLSELENSYHRVRAEKEFKKEAIENFVEKVGKDRMSKKQVTLAFKLYLLERQNKLDQTQDEQDSILHLVEQITGKAENE